MKVSGPGLRNEEGRSKKWRRNKDLLDFQF